MADDSMGALWIKDGKNGKYMSGVVEIDGVKHNIVVFKNNYKERENQPDYRILKPKPKDAPKEETKQDDFKDDIPF